jgi:putative salt-induced outer membrane protein
MRFDPPCPEAPVRPAIRSLPSVAALLLALPSAAAAQEEPRRFTFLASLGYVNAAGNMDFTSLTGEERVDYVTADSTWRYGQHLAAVYGKTSDSTTANALRLGGRVDRFVTSRLSAFAGVGWERNRFAGISRRLEELVGLAYLLLASPSDELRVEGGASFNQQRSVAGLSDEFVAARAAAAYKHTFFEKAYFQQLAEVLPNLETGDDLRVNAESALVAPLSDLLSLKLGYAIRYDKLPEPGFEKTDRVFSSGLQITF